MKSVRVSGKVDEYLTQILTQFQKFPKDGVRLLEAWLFYEPPVSHRSCRSFLTFFPLSPIDTVTSLNTLHAQSR